MPRCSDKMGPGERRAMGRQHSRWGLLTVTLSARRLEAQALLLLVLQCALLQQGAFTTASQIRDSSLGLSEVLWGSEIHHDYIGSPSIVEMTTGAGTPLLIASLEHFNKGPQPSCAPGIIPSEARGSDPESNSRHGSGAHKSPFPHYPQPLWREAADRMPRNCRNNTVGAACPHQSADDGEVPHVTSVFHSSDGGIEWAPIGNISGAHFVTLFVGVDGHLYSTGTGDGGFGVQMGRSTDFGHTWNISIVLPGNWTGGSTPVIQHKGNLYRALEWRSESQHAPFPQKYHATLLWANASHDLLDPKSWRRTPDVPFNRSWIPPEWAKYNWTSPGYLEGNPVVGPDGRVFDMLRVNSLPMANVAALLAFDEEEGVLQFEQLVVFPGGMSKFDVRFDPVTKLYMTFSNNVHDLSCPSARNNLTLATSPDLVNWTVERVVLEDDSGLSAYDSMRYTGFHYVSWQFDHTSPGAAHLLIRTAYRGANSYHNSNRITYKRVLTGTSGSGV